MGFFYDLMDKIGKGMEKVMSKNLTGESKEQYEKEKAEKAQSKLEKQEKQQQLQTELDSHKIAVSKTQLKELEPILEKMNTLDEEKIWIGGFDNFRANQNAKAANLFSGNKNIKTLSKHGDDFYVCKYLEEHFVAVKKFAKEDVANFAVEGMVSKSVKLELRDGFKYSVDVSENKEKLTTLKELLK